METFLDNIIPPLDFRTHINLIHKFTEVYKANLKEHKAVREINCMKAMFPGILADIQPGDTFAGKIRHPAICFTPQAYGNEGGFGYVCRSDLMKELTEDPQASQEDIKLLKDLWQFWKTENSIYKTRQAYPPELKKGLPSDRWIDEPGIAFPLYRMAGTHLDYHTLVTSGINGLKSHILELQQSAASSDQEIFYHSAIEALDLFSEICLYYAEASKKLSTKAGSEHREELNRIETALRNISHSKPGNLREAIQLSYLYCIVSGSQNYGRIDDYLGEFYCNDLENGVLTNETAGSLFEGYWRIMISRNAVYDGRAIIGGKGRRNEATADRLALLAIETAGKVKDVLPQLTLRFHSDQNPELYERALDVIGSGSTFPMLYNDDVNIPASLQAFDIPNEDACQVIPFGCGEYIINHRSVGTPSGVFNLLKALEVMLHNGTDPVTGKPVEFNIQTGHLNTFEEFYEEYKRFVCYYIDLMARQEEIEYNVAGETAPFLYFSILYDHCLERGKGIFSGGVVHLGGTMEIYGFTSASDSLVAIRDLVFEKKLFSLKKLVEVLDADFEGFDQERLAMMQAPKYGNDDPNADDLAADLHDFICKYTRDQREKTGLDSYLVVNINNDANTTLGRHTSASADGRKAFTSMSNGNSPSPGMDKNGPTALLNSLVKPDPALHAGIVQNMKFSKQMFSTYRTQLEALLKTYFKNNGTQAMITVVGKDDLVNAMKDPEKYYDLIVRVGGFSARFVELSKEVQLEILNRTLY